MAIGPLKLTPDVFWRMTFHEFYAMTDALNPHNGAPTVDDVDKWSQLYPDDN